MQRVDGEGAFRLVAADLVREGVRVIGDDELSLGLLCLRAAGGEEPEAVLQTGPPACIGTPVRGRRSGVGGKEVAGLAGDERAPVVVVQRVAERAAEVLPPDLVTTLTTPPVKRPNSAEMPALATVVSWIASSIIKLG